ncbi:MAG: FAD-binding oxidoreductase [Sulfitobacter sp.]
MNVQITANAPGFKPFWADTAPQSELHPALAGAINTDVTVIGAGFTGLRAALMLAEAGTSVTVLDAGDVAYGASGRSGGQVNPMLPFNPPSKLRKILGEKHFERLTETSLGSADELFDLIKTYQIDCEARQNGWLRVLHNDRALRHAREGVTEWNAHGAGMQIIEGADVAKLSGSNAYRAAVITPKGGAVQPLSLALGLAQAGKQRGVQIFGGSAVTSLTPEGDKWIAKTAQGAVTSDWVIVATNGYTDNLIPKLAKSVIPVHPVQMATEALPPEVIDTILPQGHTISDSRRVIMYARREPGNRMVYGGHGKALPNGQIAGFDWLRRDAERVFPQLKGVGWSHRWGGRIAITDDHLPHLHEPRKGLLVGLGYNGRGVAMSNVMGRVMAERVLGKAGDALPFPTSPIKAIPFQGVQVRGLGSVVWFMKLMDYLETR